MGEGMKMKHSVITALLLASAIVPAAAKEVWQGDLFITVATPACADIGFANRDFLRAVYRPRNITDNGANTSLLLIGARNAARITVTNNTFATNRPFSGKFFTSRAGEDDWNATLGPTAVTAVNANTPSVTIKTQIKNFDATAGCNVSLEGTLTHRPD
jgi:hypothetical protein